MMVMTSEYTILQRILHADIVILHPTIHVVPKTHMQKIVRMGGCGTEMCAY